MNKQQILNITGLTEKEFYNKYPDQESFCNDYPQACQQLAQAAEGIEVTGSLTSPEEIQKLGKAYGFRTDSNKNFQQDMYNYVGKNKPELFKESINKFGPANAGLTNYGSVQGYRPDAYIGPRVADMMGRLGTPAVPQAPKQPQAPKYVEYSNANVRQQYDFNRGMQQKYVGSNVAPTPIPSQPAMPATFPGQQPVASFSKNPAGGWNIGPAQAPGQPGGMPARQQGAAPAQGGQPQMSHMGPWHTNQQGEYTRYYTNTPGDMNPGVQPGATLATQAYGGEMIKRADGSYSKRGLWDNIRANAGSGKEPTKEMLEQERKIKMAEGGEQDDTQASIMAALKQGMKPQEILKKLVAMGLTKEQAAAYIQSAIQHPGSQYDNTYVNDSNYDYMAEGGEKFEIETVQPVDGLLTNDELNYLGHKFRGNYSAEYVPRVYFVNKKMQKLTDAQHEQLINYMKNTGALTDFWQALPNVFSDHKGNSRLFQEGGEPNGGMALGQMMAVADKMSKLSKFVTPDKNLDPWIASKLAVMDDSAAAISDYMMYNPEAGNEQEMDEMKNGGYVVRRSHDRKGKTHVVIGPDGTKKYFGDPNMGERGKSKYGKEAFYARHKKNLEKNPYFRAYARATWEEGGEIEDQGGSMFAYGGIHLDPAKKGTFKAQATRMDMSVQEAASHILANKEDYSPAMVKKANFARNFAKEEGGQIAQYRHGGYIGMDGKFHMAKGSGTFSGNAYYVNGGEEDPNLTAPYDGSNPNAPLPPFDPTAYQAMQLPTGYTGYSKKDPATGQFVPIENVRKDDLWKHLSGSQKWNTGQTATQKVGRAIGDVGNAVNYGIAAAGAYSNYLQNNEKEAEYNNYMQNMGTTASLYGPSAAGTSRGDYSVTGSSYGQLRPNQMGNMSGKGMTQGMQFGAYGGQTMYTIGGGVFDALLTDADASSPVVYNPLSSMPAFRQPNAVDNTYVNQPTYKLKSLPNGANNDEDFGERLANIESKGDYKALPWADSSRTKLASSAAGKYQFLWNTHKDKIKELTGVSTKQQFLNSPEAQEAYFNYWDDNILTPEALKLKQQYNLELPLNKIKAAVHQAGPAGARKYFSRGEAARDAFGMDTGKYINRFQEGGIVEMTDTEIKQFLANGGQLEFLD